MASRCSSDLRPAGPRARPGLRLFGVLVVLVGLASGCRTVRPEEKEHLADPAMTFGGDGAVAAHDEHVYSNREGSFGAGGVTGGGCGCN